MALIIADRVKETTTTEGTGRITLSGATFGGFQTFGDTIGDGNSTYYCIQNDNNFEIGLGTYRSSDNTLSRDTVYESSNSDNLISIDGVGTVLCVIPAGKLLYTDSDGVITPSGLTPSGENFDLSGNILTYNNSDDGSFSVDLGGLATEGSLPTASGEFYLQEIRTNSTSGVTISGSLQPQITQNTSDILTVSGLLYDDAGVSGYFESRIDQADADILTVSGLLYDDTATSGYFEYRADKGDSNTLTVSGLLTPSGESFNFGSNTLTYNNSDGGSFSVDLSSLSTGDTLPVESGELYLQEIRTNSASGIAISGWVETYVDSQDHSAVSVSGWADSTMDARDTAVSGWAEAYVDSQDHAGVAVSGWSDSTMDARDAAVSGWAEAYVDSQDHSAVAVSGHLQPQVTENSNDINVVSGLLTPSGENFSLATNLLTYNNSDGGSFSVDLGGLAPEGGLSAVSGEYYLQEIRSNSASGVAISGYFESRVDNLDVDIATVSGLLYSDASLSGYFESRVDSNESNITTNTTSINTVSGLIPSNTFNITAGDGSDYTIDGMGLNSASDPTMYMHKGHTYILNKTFSGHPFRVSTTDGGSVYSDADGNNIEIGSAAGSIAFEVPQNAPDKLYYYCTAHPSNMKGLIYTTPDGSLSGYFESRVDSADSDITTVSGLLYDDTAISGYFESRVDSADSSITANSGYFESRVDSADSNITANSGYFESRVDTNVADIITVSGLTGGGGGGGLPYSSGDYYLQEIRTNSASGIAISGWAQAYVDAQDHSAVDVSGSLQPQITQNADDISDVSGLLYSSWTIADADGVSEDVFSGTNITFSGVGQTEVAYNTSTNVVSISGAPDTGGDTSALEADLAYISGIAVYGSGLDQYLLNPSGGSGITITSDPDYVVFSVDDSIARVDDLINHTAGSGLTLAGTEFNVYGGSGQFIDLKLQSDGIDDLLTLTSTNDGSSAAPVICTMRDSASPADGDYLGQIKFKGRSDTATERVYAKITGKTLDVTNGTEDGLIEIAVRADGSNKIISRLRNDGLRMINDADIYIQDNGSLGVRVSPSYSLHVRDDAYIGSLEVEDDLNIGGVATFDQVVNLQSGVKTNINTEADAATITFDMDQSNVHMATLEDNRTLAVSNVDVGQKFLIRLKQDGTGSRTATWFNNIQWSDGGTTPTLTTTEHKADLFGFLCTSGGFYDGFICGQNI